MGFFNAYEFLPTAFEVLKEEGGVIHYHEVCPNELFPGRLLQRLRKVGKDFGKNTEMLKCRKIKSYAPWVSHVVIDIKVA